jgi:hypothetical protein
MEISWRLFWMGDDNETVVYVGSYRVGSIARIRKHGRIVYEGNLHVPHVYGPVVQEESMVAARKGMREKIEDWLGRFSDEPPEDTQVKTRRAKAPESPARKKRTRSAPAAQARRRRVR